MISLRTNLSSIITQQSLTNSTNKLNQAIERMSTGCKINHAGDNAANYSIATNMDTQLNAYTVAQDNIAMGMDLLAVAQDTIAGMQDRGSRLQALMTQARNGIYGASSMAAITQEAAAIAAEINRLYMSTEYNGKSLLNLQLPDWIQGVKEAAGLAESKQVGAKTDAGVEERVGVGLRDDIIPRINGFIEGCGEYPVEINVTHADDLLDALKTFRCVGIGSDEVLVELARIVNGDHGYDAFDCQDKTIVLTDDIDISRFCASNTDGEGFCGWVAIGNSKNPFAGAFDGNGHTIDGLYIASESEEGYQGLFGYSTGSISNVGLNNGCITAGGGYIGTLVGYTEGNVDNCYVKSNEMIASTNDCGCVGGLVGYAEGIINVCYSICNVNGGKYTGGLVGKANDIIQGSFSNCTVYGSDYVGGLAGTANDIIFNSYATGTVEAYSDYVGGLVGFASGEITSCYAATNVAGHSNYCGGLVGLAESSITQCYATGNVTGQGDSVGGLAGEAASVTNCYATGNVSGVGNYAGGLVGYTNGVINHCYATGSVEGGGYAGGLLGATADENGQEWVTNCYATGNVTKSTGSNVGCIGGLAGRVVGSITNCYSTGSVTASVTNSGGSVGGLAGEVLSVNRCHATGNVIANCNNVGGLVGYVLDVGKGRVSNIIGCYATGNVSGLDNFVGGLVGNAGAGGFSSIGTSLNNCYATGDVTGGCNYTGGLAGALYGSITNCYATGNVRGENICTGGLAGSTDGGNISNSYATGNVTGLGEKTGGFIGYAQKNITNCYATGNVTGQNETGGFLGNMGGGDITNCYTTGNVSGSEYVGGFIGRSYIADVARGSYNYVLSSGSVTGSSTVGSFIGGIIGTAPGVFNAFARPGIDKVGQFGSGILDDYIESTLASISDIGNGSLNTTFHIGINGGSDSQITVDTTFSYNLLVSDLTSDSAYNSITEFMNKLNAKAVELGAAQNRLESALESTGVNIENLTKSRSTLKDADIAKESSRFIQQQILQQAAATLMSTANQSPAIALQLI